MARSVALSLAVLLAVFEIGSCLRCYVCSTDTDPYCAFAPTSEARYIDCNTQELVDFNRNYLPKVFNTYDVISTDIRTPRRCAKLIYNNGMTLRTCLDVDQFRSSYQTENDRFCSPQFFAASYYPELQCLACNYDYCNGVSSVTFSTPLAMICLVASYLFFKQ